MATKELASKTRSLVGELWAGWCPLDGSEMCANEQDYYECPTCHLQIQSAAGGPNVLPNKGKGQFRLRGDRRRISAVDELPGLGAWSIKHDGRV